MNRFFVIVICLLFRLNSTVHAQTALKYALVLEVDETYWKAIDTNGNTLADSLCESRDLYHASHFTNDGMFVCVRDGKIGFKNHLNELVVPCIYSTKSSVGELRWTFQGEMPESRFVNGRAVVVTFNRKFGVLDRSGRMIIDTVYDYISDMEDGVFVARKGKYIKLIDKNGKDIIPFYYETDLKLLPFPRFEDGLLCVMVRNDTTQLHNYKVGFINTRGHLVIDTVYYMNTRMMGNSEDNAWMAIASGSVCGTGMRNLQNSRPNPDPYYLGSDYYRFSGGRCLVVKNHRPFVINKKGDSLFTFQFGFLSVTNHGGFFIVDARYSPYEPVGGGIGVINRDGKTILPLSFEEVHPLNDGFFRVKVDGKYRFVDTTGKFHFKTYAIADDFFDGFARVKRTYSNDYDGDYGHIDTKGRFFQVDSLWLYMRSEGLIPASVSEPNEKESRMGFLNEQYEWVLPPIYGNLDPLVNGLAGYRELNGRYWGYINRTGKVVLEPKYYKVQPFQVAIIE